MVGAWLWPGAKLRAMCSSAAIVRGGCNRDRSVADSSEINSDEIVAETKLRPTWLPTIFQDSFSDDQHGRFGERVASTRARRGCRCRLSLIWPWCQIARVSEPPMREERQRETARARI